MANVGGESETLGRVLSKWLWSPTNWIAVGSLVVSMYTFFYVQFSRGTVTIYLPKRISVTAPTSGVWQFLINVSLLNDAPSRKVKFIEDAILSVRVGDAAAPLKCPWTGTTELLLTEEYPQRFGEVKAEFRRFGDQFAPARRAMAFALLGQELQTKMLLFTCPEGGTRGASKPSGTVRLETTLAVMTPTDTYTSEKRAYQLAEDKSVTTEDGSWAWTE